MKPKKRYQRLKPRCLFCLERHRTYVGLGKCFLSHDYRGREFVYVDRQEKFFTWEAINMVGLRSYTQQYIGYEVIKIVAELNEFGFLRTKKKFY